MLTAKKAHYHSPQCRICVFLTRETVVVSIMSTLCGVQKKFVDETKAKQSETSDKAWFLFMAQTATIAKKENDNSRDFHTSYESPDCRCSFPFHVARMMLKNLLTQMRGVNMRVYLRGGYRLMAEHGLYGAQIGSALKQ